MHRPILGECLRNGTRGSRPAAAPDTELTRAPRCFDRAVEFGLNKIGSDKPREMAKLGKDGPEPAKGVGEAKNSLKL